MTDETDPSGSERQDDPVLVLARRDHRPRAGGLKQDLEQRRLEALHRLPIVRVARKDVDDHEAELAADHWRMLRARSS